MASNGKDYVPSSMTIHPLGSNSKLLWTGQTYGHEGSRIQTYRTKIKPGTQISDNIRRISMCTHQKETGISFELRESKQLR